MIITIFIAMHRKMSQNVTNAKTAGTGFQLAFSFRVSLRQIAWNYISNYWSTREYYLELGRPMERAKLMGIFSVSGHIDRRILQATGVATMNS